MKRGFAPLNKAMEKMGRKIATCKSCAYMKPDDDGIEDCRNSNVTKFDFVVEADGREYCIYWSMEERD